MTPCGHPRPPGGRAHGPGLRVAQGPLIDPGDALDVRTHPRPDAGAGLVDDTASGCPLDRSSRPMVAAWRASPLPRGVWRWHLRRGARGDVVQGCPPDRRGGAAGDAEPGSTQTTPPRNGVAIRRGKTREPGHAAAGPMASPPRPRRPSRSRRLAPTAGDESAPRGAGPSRDGSCTTVGPFGHGHRGRSSGKGPSSSRVRSATASRPSPDAVGVAWEAPETGVNQCNRGASPAWAVAPRVENGGGSSRFDTGVSRPASPPF
jgi:hypothetical protein